jgi:hypothetical protein
MKELLWFEDALANGYQRQLWYSKIIVLKSHDKMDTYNDWHTYSTGWETMRGNLDRKESKRWLGDAFEWR